MADMSVHKFLKKLNLNHNNITKIEGVEKNLNLEVISFLGDSNSKLGSLSES